MASKSPKSGQRRSNQFLKIGFAIIGALIFAAPLLSLIPNSSQQAANLSLQQRQQLVTSYIQENGIGSLTANAPSKGTDNADVVLVEFSDFQCAFCASAVSTVEAFMERHGDSVQMVYKHFPISTIHPEARPAALASWAAQQQNKFWEFHDELFLQQESLGEQLYLATAEKLELDMEKFDLDRRSREARQAIEADLEIANELRFTSTPTFLMNEVLIPGAAPLSIFEQILAGLQQIESSPAS